MWGLLVLLAVGAHGLKQTSNVLAPPYVESRTSFTHTRLYLQESLPYETNDITDPEARKHFAFGIIAAVSGTIAKNYSQARQETYWLSTLYERVPLAWEHYNSVSTLVNQLLADANLKIQPITVLIDALCTSTDSNEDCNALVENKIKHSDQFLRNRARLLLALGDVSDMITAHEHGLNTAAREYTVVPYLLEKIGSQSYARFIRALANVYNILFVHDSPH